LSTSNLEKIYKSLRKQSFKNLEELTQYISKKYELNRYKAAKTVFLLWKKGYIDISPSYKSFIGYVFSIDSSWYWGLLSLIFTTIMLVFYVNRPPLIYFRYVLGSLYVLYIPGATLIEALYPRGEELSPLERLALSIGLSLALVPLVGLILNYTPWGIRLEPVTISLAILSIILSTIALKRKYEYIKIIFES